MSVRRLSNSTISTQGRGKSSTFLAGYSPAIDEMDLIERVVVGSGGTSSITFSNIPQTYQHLQVRGWLQAANSGDGWGIAARANTDTVHTNYRGHYIDGSGTTASTGSIQSSAFAGLYSYAISGNSINAVGSSMIFDLLDYTSTSKNKVSRSFVGWDRNGIGFVGIASGLWINTSAITTLTFFIGAGHNFSQYSTLSLYGVKA